ncbi:MULTISPECIES: sensor histidine kinase [unclassified Nocardiopsis]|uniref:sensor histidine kinase n=1 Tax=Nocardiopsis TaxID=2013 RepID=UPI00387B2048
MTTDGPGFPDDPGLPGGPGSPDGPDSPTRDLGTASHGVRRSAGATAVFPTMVLRDGPPEVRRHQRLLPARLIIMAWVVLLMALTLALVVLVTWSALSGGVGDRADRALTQEIAEFQEFAQVGRDPQTGEAFASVAGLMEVHLARQFPYPSEILFGWVEGGGEEAGRIRQGQEPLYDVSADPDAVAAILDDPSGRGTLQTPAGPMEWIKVRVRAPDAAGADGWFVTGYFTDPDQAAVAETVRTISLVSLVGLIAAAAAAWWVAGRILAPVRLVRQTAAEITEEDLTRRIEVSGRDDIAALAQQFNSMLDRLEGAFIEQRRFVDDAGHELRTPITIVRGHLELMGDDPQERREVVRLVTDELDRMGRIVEDLLLLAKSQQPDFVRPEPVSLAELTSDIDAHVRRLGDRDWRLEAMAEEEWRLDAQRVTQAVVQLAANAVRYTEPGSTIRIGSMVDGPDVLFWVTDQGPGIAPEEQGRIFGRFSRGGAARAGGGGAGLGLAIVRAIAEAHRGRVDLRSALGQGSTFTLVIPRGKEQQ